MRINRVGSVAVAERSAGGDASSATLALQHFDGTHNSAIIPPDEILGSVWVNSGGDSLINTGVKKFGVAGIRHANGIARILLPQSIVVVNLTLPWTFEAQCLGGTSGKNAAPHTMRATSENFAGVMLDVTLTAAPINTVTVKLIADDDSTIFEDTDPLVSDGSIFLHRAVVFDGASYSVYVNGVRIVNVASVKPLKSPFYWLFSGAPGIGIQALDEARISQVARYAGASFTPPAEAFMVD